jgi:hypothetical protein
MAWRWEATCSACAFVSRQLGLLKLCPWHAGEWSSRESRALSRAVASSRPDDRLWLSIRDEYARLVR